MTVWVDRSTQASPAAGRTHALVVGVSQYVNLPSKGARPSADEFKLGLVQVETPVAGAFAFARWLRDTFNNPDAPVATIRLLMSPSETEMQADPELTAAAAEVPRATRENVRTAMFDWWNECENDPNGIAVAYIAGHGFQLTRSDSYVLLEDFGADPAVLDYALDVGGLFRSMGGATRPQTQLYFVDACRNQPGLFAKYQTSGGIAPPQILSGEDRRAAPVYFSASPDTAALGLGGRGTLFAQALQEGLRGPAAEDGADPEGRWYVSTYSLGKALQSRVAGLAAALRDAQTAVLGGQVAPAPFHYFQEPPVFDLTLELDPEVAAGVAWFDLWDADRQQSVVGSTAFNPYPVVRPVPAGLYSLDVTIKPPTAPYVSKQGVVIPVYPSRPAQKKVTVT